MSDSELEISTRAYCKMLMHAAKYPSSSINGLLLSKVEITRPGMDRVDCPLHFSVSVSPPRTYSVFGLIGTLGPNIVYGVWYWLWGLCEI